MDGNHSPDEQAGPHKDELINPMDDVGPLELPWWALNQASDMVRQQILKI